MQQIKGITTYCDGPLILRCNRPPGTIARFVPLLQFIVEIICCRLFRNKKGANFLTPEYDLNVRSALLNLSVGSFTLGGHRYRQAAIGKARQREKIFIPSD